MKGLWALVLLSVGCTGGDAIDTTADTDTADTDTADTDTADTDTADTGPTSTPSSKVYVTLVSHNESLFNEPCDRIFDGNELMQQTKYIANRTAVVQAAQMVMEAGAAWDFQSDWRYLERVAAHDTGSVTADTDNKNLVQWLSEAALGTLTVDAHSHEHGGYNLADVAKQIVDLGGPDNGIVGGFIANPPEQANWERFWEPMVALQSSYEFQARSLWGGGSDMHVDDPRASGVWRPKDHEHFLEDDPSGTLPNIGNYTSEKLEATGVLSLLEMLRAGELEEGRLYTVTVMMSQCDLDLEGEIEQLQSVLDTLAPEVETGDLIWATLPDVLSTWQETYGASAVVLPVEE